MHHFRFQQTKLVLFVLMAFVLSSISLLPSISVAAPITTQNQHEMTQTAPCAQQHNDSMASDVNCNTADHSNPHCASCVPMQATVPMELAIHSSTSSIAKHQDTQDNIPALTLPNLSRPPIQSIWF
ncbi:hypothetical protein [Vibrio gangliei]|uniref:hypothetical protein n=1 Tax=Vibrio gangliei TaxID=2077090 RepID=UPI000D022128|nr:hypothetical protein [Vibrio gangliei]